MQLTVTHDVDGFDLIPAGDQEEEGGFILCPWSQEVRDQDDHPRLLGLANIGLHRFSQVGFPERGERFKKRRYTQEAITMAQKRGCPKRPLTLFR